MTLAEYAKLAEIMAGIILALMIWWGKYVFGRVVKLEDRQDAQAVETRQELAEQRRIMRQEHARLREDMQKYHEQVIALLINTHGGAP